MVTATVNEMVRLRDVVLACAEALNHPEDAPPCLPCQQEPSLHLGTPGKAVGCDICTRHKDEELFEGCADLVGSTLTGSLVCWLEEKHQAVIQAAAAASDGSPATAMRFLKAENDFHHALVGIQRVNG